VVGLVSSHLILKPGFIHGNVKHFGEQPRVITVFDTVEFVFTVHLVVFNPVLCPALLLKTSRLCGGGFIVGTSRRRLLAPRYLHTSDGRQKDNRKTAEM
jgi:hypothetical protein